MPAAPLVRMVVGAAAPSRGALLRAMLPRVANTVAHLQFRIRLAQRRMRGRAMRWTLGRIEWGGKGLSDRIGWYAEYTESG